MKFDDLIGKTLAFYGVDTTYFKLDDTVWQAVENESDGYRSLLGNIEVADNGDHIFYPQPLARVTVENIENGTYQGYEFEGYQLSDGDGHVWLIIGTMDYDDYYPTFIFAYSPKPPPA